MKILITLSVVLTIIDVIIFKTVIKQTDEMLEQMEGIAKLEAGETDNRIYYIIDDEEEINYRYTMQPIKGISQGHEAFIPVYGGTEIENQYIVDLMYYLPESLKQYLVNHEWKVRIVDEIDKKDHVAIVGKTVPDEKTIYLTMDDDFTIYHEVGHILKWNLNNMSKSLPDELSRLCCHNAKSSPYIYNTQNEQLAECLYDYIWYPKEFQEQAPNLYARIKLEVDEEPYKRYTNIED